MFFIKWAAIGAFLMYIVKNIDIFGIMAAMCGCVLAMVGLQLGARIVKLSLGIYILIKFFSYYGVISA